MAAVLELGVGGDHSQSSRQRALAVVALCVGGMVIARTTDDADLATAVREAATVFANQVLTG